MRQIGIRSLTISTLLCLSAPAVAQAQSCAVDLQSIEQAIARLEISYGEVLSDISCDAPTLRAHELMCASSFEQGSSLWRMGRLDDLAWVYAYENATKQEVDHHNPPHDRSFLKRRDACTDEACLCAALIEHTDASLGGESPYVEQR